MSNDAKLIKLKNNLKNLNSIAIGYSGGVDSTFLLKVATDELGNNAIGVIARSSSLPEREYIDALKVAKEFNFKIKTIETEEDKNPKFIENPVNRCFFCKDELFSKLRITADELAVEYIADGTNLDDMSEHRPGLKAQTKYSVLSPLRDAEFTKLDVRKYSKILGLPTHDKPAFACLASRFPYGSSITKEKLTKVEQAEGFLKDIGFKVVRVRHYDETARIEFSEEELSRAISKETREKIINKLKEIGYTYVTIDLEGFRSGSMNEVLKND